MTWIKYPQRGGFGIGQRRRHVRLCRLDVIATHREREREREPYILFMCDCYTETEVVSLMDAISDRAREAANARETLRTSSRFPYNNNRPLGVYP